MANTRFTLKGCLCNISTAAVTDPGTGTVPGVSIGQVKSGTVTFGERRLTDVTVSADDFEEFRAGVGGAMSADVTLIWNPADTGWAACNTAWAAGERRTFGFTFPDTGAAVVWSEGYITNISAPIGNGDNAMESTVTFRGSGKPTFTA